MTSPIPTEPSTGMGIISGEKIMPASSMALQDPMKEHM
jgi:hypothetical protein